MTQQPQPAASASASATHATSTALFEAARAVIPGGVDSPVRAFGSVGGTPRFIASASGAHVTDAEGRSYVDLVGSWGPALLGHAHPEVVSAVQEAAARGLSFGAPTATETLLAEEVRRRVPAAQRVRFVSTGTEATMTAVRLARGATGRDLVVKFAGCYHGHSDGLLAAAGSGLATGGLPGSAGGKALRLFGGPDGTLRLIGCFAVSFRLRTGFALGLPFVALCLRLLGGLERVGPHPGFKGRHLLSFSLGERKVGDTFVRGRRPKPPDSGQDDEDHQQHKKAITKFAGEGRENTSHKSLNCQSFVKQV